LTAVVAKFQENYLAAFTSMNSIMKSRGFISTYAALNVQAQTTGVISTKP